MSAYTEARKLVSVPFGQIHRKLDELKQMEKVLVNLKETVRPQERHAHELGWKFFPPYEVKLTVEEAKAFLGQTAELCRSIIEPEVVTLAKDAEKTVYSVRIDRMKPDHLALLLITDVLGAHIGSGFHHAYRGMLSMTGKDMLKVWHTAQKAMFERGYASEQEVNENNNWIQKQIKGTGKAA